MRIEQIEALIEEHKRNDWPGMVLPVAHVETLFGAYRQAQQTRQMGLRALLDHDIEGARNALRQLPDNDS